MSLPTAASLEQLRKRAKELLRAARAGDVAALRRIAAHHRRPAEVPKLAEAQLVIAREHGFPSWARLRSYVERLERFGPALRHAYRADLDYYAERAVGLLASAEDGTAEALAAFAAAEAPLTRAGARAVVAGQHGFASWAELRRHVAGLATGGEPFARAYRAVEAHDVDGLAELLDRFPELVTASGTNGNDLLGMATATCDERLVRLLLGRGADPAHANDHGWTALHGAAYAGRPALALPMIEAGAPMAASARGDGGTPLVVALFWGHREAAELLAEHGTHPGNLRVAAGLGRVEMIERLVAPDGRLTPEAGAHRGFYRPHSGFPAWRPSDDPAEVRDEALTWAARNDRPDAVDLLVRRGARVEADVYRGTALVWAAACGRVGAVRRLLELGADPNRRGTFGGPTHGLGVTALHLAAQNDALPVIRLLLAAGADPTVRDELHDGTPASWAEHFGNPASAELLSV
ncbi:Ankyrin repeat-containing protein [Amycolatopsis arida]|uniref:Ankyrin repeat-containing protein n=1 Tax=Amycolatopsis arida TaxID=587909 RepID=A0A1I5NU03_9PSEU|nr:ankyrin repeat domain-containing protein [Amycolatopsis arida]TDX98244.1 ankyrin repeat protein [Amycolatopsis arida]SFP25279.1 Ankyrin repeat-containing protein [Amycolatopsis arida]